jgi:hypothetical protein
MHKKQLIDRKPGYFRGQLLLEDDFIAEQRYHANGRHRHTLNLHGWGVVRGLDVTRVDESTIAVSPGLAVDGLGHEMELQHEERLNLSSLPAQSQVVVSLSYEADTPAPAGESGQRTLNCYAVLHAAVGVEEGAVILASVQIDDHGHVGHHAISGANRRHLRTPIAPGSVSPRELDARLRCGWLRMPFRPMPLPPEKEEESPVPPFRVGPTEARAHRDYRGAPNELGAGGSMAIALPPGVVQVLALRVAGEQNEKGLHVALILGGWDAQHRKHVAHEALKVELKSPGGGKDSSFDETWSVANGELHLETSTLALEIQSTGYARISLIAVQVSYLTEPAHHAAPGA